MLAECRLFLRCEADCTFFPVEADRRAVEKMSDTAVGDHFVRRAVQEFAAVDHYDTVAKVECDVQVVRRKKDRFAVIVRKRAKQEPDLVFVRQIEKRRRFVEQDHRRILGQRTGDHDPLPLTVAEGVDTLVAERFHSHQPQGLFHCRAVGRPIQLV